MAFINNEWQLYLFFGLIVGIGVSGLVVPMQSTIARWFTKRRGLMTGIILSGVGLGQIIMPPLSSQLILSQGWRNTYIILGIMALVVALIVTQFLRRAPAKEVELLDGYREDNQTPLNSDGQIFTLKEALRTTQFILLFGITLCFGFIMHAITLHIVPHALDLGLSPMIAASILSIIGGLSMAGRIVMGGSADRIGSKRSIVIVLVLTITALFGLGIYGDLSLIYLFSVLFGLGYGGMIALPSLITAELFGLRAHGAILGAVIFGGTIGGSIGSIVTGRIFDLTGNYSSAFMLSAILAFVCLILGLLLKPISKQYAT
jgi:MFS family permease